MLKYIVFHLVLGLTLALPAHAETWQVDIDTTQLAGKDGYLDFQLNPGASDVQTVEVQISHFGSDATLGAYRVDGAASGSLSDVLVLENSEALNAWLQELVFGSHIVFTLDLNTAFTASSGSSFVALLWDADFNPLLTAEGEDAALRIDLASGSFPSWVASSSVQVSTVPEPSVAVSLLAGLGLVGFASRRGQASRGNYFWRVRSR